MEPLHAYPEGAERYERFREEVWAQGLAASGGDNRTEFAARVAEDPLRREDELEVQARWFGGEFGRSFTGLDGERVELVQFGHWNRSAGPDFTEAAVRVDGELLAGAVEIDLDARDWERHGHGASPDFDPVVLHVFTDGPASLRSYTRTSQHRKVCQVQLPQYAWAQGPPDFLPEAFPGRCLAPLAAMAEEEVATLLLAAAQFRLREKAERFRVMESCLPARQVLFQGVAEALGYYRNRLPMAVLAQRCPLGELMGGDPMDREARLFGAAGFLREETYAEAPPGETRDYLRSLWERWWRMRHEIETVPKRAIPWRLSGSRPLNHPHRRIGTLAALLSCWDGFASLLGSGGGGSGPVSRRSPGSGGPRLEQDVNNFLKNFCHPFWSRHYTLRAESTSKPRRLLGKDRVRDILGNVVFPVLIKDEPAWWPEYLQLGGADANQKLRRALLRLFGPDRKRKNLFTRYYHQQQGLLQIYQDFCLKDLSQCSGCPFPEQLMQWRGARASMR